MRTYAVSDRTSPLPLYGIRGHLPLGRVNVLAYTRCWQLSMTVAVNARNMMAETRAGVRRDTQRRTRAWRVCGHQREEDTAVVVAHHNTAEKAFPALLWWYPHLSCARVRKGLVVMDVERFEEGVISLCGEGGVCEVMKTGLQLARSGTNFNQRARLAGFITPRVVVYRIVRE